MTRSALVLATVVLWGCRIPTREEVLTRSCSTSNPCTVIGYRCSDAGSCEPDPGECDAGATGPCGSSVGECRLGRRSCGENRYWGPCDGGVGPTAEVCDRKDNDCDGVIDGSSDAGPVQGTACELSEGICAGSRRACVNGQLEALCTNTSYGSGYSDPDVTCDESDADCDGDPDTSVFKPISSRAPSTFAVGRTAAGPLLVHADAGIAWATAVSPTTLLPGPAVYLGSNCDEDLVVAPSGADVAVAWRRQAPSGTVWWVRANASGAAFAPVSVNSISTPSVPRSLSIASGTSTTAVAYATRDSGVVVSAHASSDGMLQRSASFSPDSGSISILQTALSPFVANWFFAYSEASGPVPSHSVHASVLTGTLVMNSPPTSYSAGQLLSLDELKFVSGMPALLWVETEKDGGSELVIASGPTVALNPVVLFRNTGADRISQVAAFRRDGDLVVTWREGPVVHLATGLDSGQVFPPSRHHTYWLDAGSVAAVAAAEGGVHLFVGNVTHGLRNQFICPP